MLKMNKFYSDLVLLITINFLINTNKLSLGKKKSSFPNILPFLLNHIIWDSITYTLNANISILIRQTILI